MSNHSYPRIVESGRKPSAERDGGKQYGKPCVICGTGTVGAWWIQVNYFRGEDVEARVCARHWKSPKQEIIDAWVLAGQKAMVQELTRNTKAWGAAR